MANLLGLEVRKRRHRCSRLAVTNRSLQVFVGSPTIDGRNHAYWLKTKISRAGEQITGGYPVAGTLHTMAVCTVLRVQGKSRFVLQTALAWRDICLFDGGVVGSVRWGCHGVHFIDQTLLAR